MPPNVFLSFATEHKALVDSFRSQAASDDSHSPLKFRDYSIKEPIENAWKTHAERLIRASAATICLVGDTTWRSEPVNWEIRKSVELGKRIFAVYLQPNASPIPAALAEIGVTPMPWDLNTIVSKLNDPGIRAA